MVAVANGLLFPDDDVMLCHVISIHPSRETHLLDCLSTQAKLHTNSPKPNQKAPENFSFAQRQYKIISESIWWLLCVFYCNSMLTAMTRIQTKCHHFSSLPLSSHSFYFSLLFSCLSDSHSILIPCLFRYYGGCVVAFAWPDEWWPGLTASSVEICIKNELNLHFTWKWQWLKNLTCFFVRLANKKGKRWKR